MSNIPKLRFPEFSGEWEKSELGKFTQEITRVNPNSDAPIMMISAANGFILQSNKYSKEMTGQSLKKYIELHAGEFAYNHGASKLKKYGACFCLDLDKARIPFVYHCFKLTEGNTKFFSYLLNRTQLDSELARYISSSARMDGLLNISYTDYMKINISIPTHAEQQKIADFLSNVDSIITTETKILNTLQKKKKALMQKLFTQQLRFKSDDGTDFPAWEEKKLITEFPFIRNGFVGVVTDFFTTEIDGIKYIEGTNIHDGKISSSINLFVTKEFHNTHKNSQLKENDILMVQSGHVGETAVVPKELENSNCHALIIMSNEGNCSSEYVNYYFQSNKGKKQLSILTTGSTIKHILASDM